jgi:hypothetical protein
VGIDLREEAFLHLACDLDLAGDTLAMSDLGGEVFEEFRVFERESGLGGDGLEELAVGAGVGFLRALGAESNDAGETVAARERNEELGGEIVEGGALSVRGVDEPAGGVVTIDVGGSAEEPSVGDNMGAAGVPVASCRRYVSPERRKTAMRSMWRVSPMRWVMVLSNGVTSVKLRASSESSERIRSVE